MYTHMHKIIYCILKITLLVFLIRIFNNVSFEKMFFIGKFYQKSKLSRLNWFTSFHRWSFPHWTSCCTLKLCCLPSTTWIQQYHKTSQLQKTEKPRDELREQQQGRQVWITHTRFVLNMCENKCVLFDVKLLGRPWILLMHPCCLCLCSVGFFLGN